MERPRYSVYLPEDATAGLVKVTYNLLDTSQMNPSLFSFYYMSQEHSTELSTRSLILEILFFFFFGLLSIMSHSLNFPPTSIAALCL